MKLSKNYIINCIKISIAPLVIFAIGIQGPDYPVFLQFFSNTTGEATYFEPFIIFHRFILNLLRWPPYTYNLLVYLIPILVIPCFTRYRINFFCIPPIVYISLLTTGNYRSGLSALFFSFSVYCLARLQVNKHYLLPSLFCVFGTALSHRSGIIPIALLLFSQLLVVVILASKRDPRLNVKLKLRPSVVALILISSFSVALLLWYWSRIELANQLLNAIDSYSSSDIGWNVQENAFYILPFLSLILAFAFMQAISYRHDKDAASILSSVVLSVFCLFGLMLYLQGRIAILARLLIYPKVFFAFYLIADCSKCPLSKNKFPQEVLAFSVTLLFVIQSLTYSYFAPSASF